ncbi:MAG TPA: dihydropteroate synthase [Ignavibacteriaceae bacterium]|nr:dihydropteroate synthase [Ignavibacteriaceae bacterium]
MREGNREIRKGNPEIVRSNSYIIGGKEFKFDLAYVMGILNVTPDSFSDGGVYFRREDAVKHGIEMFDMGADIIDIGGESTRPGSEGVSAFEEMNRVIPVLESILSKRPEAVISVDTTKSRVASEALKRGAKIVNDISGGTFEPELLNVVSDYEAALIIMHIQGTPKTMQQNPSYDDLINDILAFLITQAAEAKKAGISKIIIDPGIGFGKSFEHNLTIIRELNGFRSAGYPVMIGISRKSFIKKLIDDLTADRDVASAVINALAIKNGATFIRTHNVLFGLQVCRLMNNIKSL